MDQIDYADVEEYLRFIGGLEAGAFRQMADLAEQARERLEHGAKLFGDALPWEKTHPAIRFRPGEVTLIAGVNGHGKSTLLSQLMAHWSLQSSVAVASFEMPLDALAALTARQMAACVPKGEEVAPLLERLRGRYWVYDETDGVEPERVFGVCVYAAGELGCRHIVIDSLVKCGLDHSEGKLYAEQKEFFDRLCWIAKRWRVHIHLVHHMRKGRSESDRGDKWDVKGAGELSDLTDNLLLAWRNKPKEAARRDAETIGAALEEKWASQPDAVINVAKQRHGEWEGDVALWFDPASRQYVGGRHEMPSAM